MFIIGTAVVLLLKYLRCDDSLDLTYFFHNMV